MNPLSENIKVIMAPTITLINRLPVPGSMYKLITNVSNIYGCNRNERNDNKLLIRNLKTHYLL